LYDETIDLNSQVDAARTLHSFEFLVDLKKKFPYQSAGSIYGKSQNLYVVCIPWAADTAGGVAVGSWLLTWDLIFKD